MKKRFVWVKQRNSSLLLSWACISCGRMVGTNLQMWTALFWSSIFWTMLFTSHSKPIHRCIPSVSRVTHLPYQTYNWYIAEDLWLSVFPFRYDTEKHSLRHQEECEKTAQVCLCSWCQRWQCEVGVPTASWHGDSFMTIPRKSLNVCSEYSKLGGQANVAAIPSHWDKTQLSETGFKV